MRAFRIIFISLVAVLTFLSWFYGERPDNSYGPGAEVIGEPSVAIELPGYIGTPVSEPSLPDWIEIAPETIPIEECLYVSKRVDGAVRHWKSCEDKLEEIH